MVNAVESAELSRDLSKILARVRAGDRFVITEAGRAVAELRPAMTVTDPSTVVSETDKSSLDETIQAFRELRSRTVPTTPAEIREMINEGRR